MTTQMVYFKAIIYLDDSLKLSHDYLQNLIEFKHQICCVQIYLYEYMYRNNITFAVLYTTLLKITVY